MTSLTGSAQRILKKSVSLDETCLGGRWLVFACSRRPLWRVSHVLGRGRWKSQNRKIVPLSPYVEEPINSKVIKCFVPEQRSRQVFFVFRDSYVMFYLYGHSMYVSHIAISWLWYTLTSLHYSLYSWQKNEEVFPSDIFRLKDSSKSFFPFIQHPFFFEL